MDQKTAADLSKLHSIIYKLNYYIEGATTTGGLESADVWGDEDDVSKIKWRTISKWAR